MSIQTAIDDLRSRIYNAFAVLEEKGIDIPEEKTTYTLKTVLEDAEFCQTDIYTKVKYQNGVEAFFEIAGTLDANLIPNLSDIVEINVGIDIDNIATGIFSDCVSLTSVTIHNKTWQDAIDNSYWGISDPNIMHGDWDRYLSFANAQTAASTVKLQANGSAPEIHLLSSSTAVDGSWQYYDLTADIELAAKGDRVFLKAGKPDDETFVNERFGSSSSNYQQFVMTGKIAANGSIMSLLDGKNNLVTINENYCFVKLFQSCASLMTAPLLPASKLSDSCYYIMFNSCTNLKNAPKLAATNLASSCYYRMFDNCTALIAAPELPAIKLTSFCYYAMFRNCKALISAPKLLATTLVNSCYYQMFTNCNSLNNINVNFSMWNPTNATTAWLQNVGTSVPETTFICPNQLDISIRSNDRIPEDTGTHTWNIVKVQQN